jgi:lipid II:glycine glycyltransferase (peptidoglycan interpeptide bridge formation enzyme)
MNVLRSARRSAAENAGTRETWDSAALRLGGHLLQSWRWGGFKSLHGWSVERIAVGGDVPRAMAQILFRRRGPAEIGYIPRGPIFSPDDPDALRELFAAIDRRCKERGVLYLIVEPDRPLPFEGRIKSEGFVRGPDHVQPSRTVKVPLLDDEPLLNQMRQKTRYSVRLAQRRGVLVEHADLDEVSGFYRLLADTSSRNEFGIHSEAYYHDFVRIFGDDALVLFSTIDGERAAGLIAARFGNEAIYMYGGSSSVHRAHGAAFVIQFEAMRWAREAGSRVYDLWGIPAEDPQPSEDAVDRVSSSKGDDWRGLYKFKTGFGGEIVTYPSTLERRYHPVLGFVARRASSLIG